MSKSNKIFFLPAIFLMIPFSSTAQGWIVPPDKGRVLSPFGFTEETQKAGEALFISNCKNCHGDPGKGNSIALTPRPPDPGSEQMQKNTDGEMFFKIREGKGAMPSFKNTLSASGIWNIISYFRSFNKGYQQQIASKREGIEGKTRLSINWLKEEKRLEAQLTNEDNHSIRPLAGEEVQLFVVRYFGNLPIDKIKETDKYGKASFDIPSDLPGDSLGYLKINVRLADESKYGEIKTDTAIVAGIPTWKPPLTKERSMWNVVQKAPLWLLLSYVSIVLTIWAFIFYVLYLLRVIYVTGKKNQINQE